MPGGKIKCCSESKKRVRSRGKGGRERKDISFGSKEVNKSLESKRTLTIFQT